MPEILDVQTEPVKTAQADAPVTEPTNWMPLTDEQRNSAPEGVKKLLETTKWGSVEEIANGYAELQKFTGVGKHIVIPDVDDTKGWDNVWNQLGRPETSDGYTLEPNEAINDELASKWKQFAHSQHYTQDQMAGAVQFQLDIIESIANTEAEEKLAADELLKSEWKEQYSDRVAGARMVADKLGIYDTLKAKNLISDPDIIRMLDVIKSRSAEDVITPQSPPAGQKTSQEELEEIKASDAFKQRFHEKHKETMTRYMELNNLIANSGQAPKRYQGG
jgi:hypothetical protein